MEVSKHRSPSSWDFDLYHGSATWGVWCWTIYGLDIVTKETVKHTLNNLVKSIYYGTYLKFYRKNGVDIDKYYEIHLNRHVANFAFSANIALLMGGKIKTAEYISGRYADILADIYMSYACLWFYKKNKTTKDIDKLLEYSINDYSKNIEINDQQIKPANKANDDISNKENKAEGTKSCDDQKGINCKN